MDALLAEPMALQIMPERVGLACDILDALVRIRFGEDIVKEAVRKSRHADSLNCNGICVCD